MQVLTPREVGPMGPLRTRRRPILLVPVAVLVVLAVRFFGGWWMKSATHQNPTAVGAGYEKLTARQVQMRDVVEQLRVAVSNADGTKAASLFAPNGSMATPEGTSTVADGSLASAIRELTSVPANVRAQTILEPMVINGTSVLFFGTDGRGLQERWVFEFTSSGDVLIVSATRL